MPDTEDAPPDARPARRGKPTWPGPFSHVGRDLSASIVVFLVALPLCMGIAIASGMPVSAGIITGIVGGIVVGCLAGSPLQVSGPAAGLTVIVYGIVQDHGPEVLGLCVLIGGALQVAAGLAKLGAYFRAVSPAVIRGMLTGIGVLIFASQFHVMVDDEVPGGGLKNLVTIPTAIRKGLPWPELRPEAERAEQVDLLRRGGRLHEAQGELAKDLAGSVPTDFAPTLIDDDDPAALAVAAGLATEAGGLADRQAALAERFAPLRERLEASGLTDGPGGKTRAKAADAAAAALAAAEARLRAAAADGDGVDGPAGDRPGAGPPVAAALRARAAVGAAEEALLDFERSLKNHHVAAKVGLFTIAVLIGWQFLTSLGPLKKLAVLPAPLVAVAAALGLAWWFILPVLYVEVPDNLLSEISFPTRAVLTGADWGAVLGGAGLIAAVASAESLLCAAAVDKLHDGPRSDLDRELAAQGVGNVICGAFGALPMTGVIVRSSANVRSGARTRLSATLHGIWLLIFAAALGWLLALIPTAALAGVLVFIGWKLIDYAAVPELWKHGRGEAVVFLTTVAVIVAQDLLTGVIVGIVLAAGRLLLKFGRLDVEVDTSGRKGDDPPHEPIHLRLNGAATFLQLPKLADALESIPPETDVRADLSRLSYIDHACWELLADWRTQHEAAGGSLNIDWDLLSKRTRAAAGPTDARTPPPDAVPDPPAPVVPERTAAETDGRV